MIDPQRDPMGVESVESVAAAGFDYIELSLAHLTGLGEEAFEGVRDRVSGSGLRCEACNNFFPPGVRLTGPSADLEAALRYGALALERAGRLGVEVVVLGSSGAKNVPDGFPMERAREQFLALLRSLGPLAQSRGITIAVEPISRPEANFVLRTEEGMDLVREADHPGIRLLVDYFHMAGESEDPSVIREAGDLIRHAHFARPGDRVFPLVWEERFDSFFQALGAVGYRGRLSIEAFTTDFEAEGRRTVALVRQAGRRFLA